jgi:hypothetical protein
MTILNLRKKQNKVRWSAWVFNSIYAGAWLNENRNFATPPALFFETNCNNKHNETQNKLST